MLTDSKPPVVTFALIAYNQEKYIRKAVEGALAQTYASLEIILSDDCSTDETYDIIKDVADKYEGPHKILINRNPDNLGLSGHVNKIFEMASGEWIVMAAGDDISDVNRVSCLMGAIENRPNATAVTSSWRVIDDNDNDNDNGYSLPDRFIGGRVDEFGDYSWVDKFLTGGSIGVHGATSMWKRNLMDIFGPLDRNVPAEDGVLSFRAYLTGSVVYVPDVLVSYRKHSDNLFGLSHVDPVFLEERRLKFERRGSYTIRQIQEDFSKFKIGEGEAGAVCKISKLVEWSIFYNKTKVAWWDMGIAWRLRKLFFFLWSGNYVEVRWCLKRLGSKKSFGGICRFLDKLKFLGKQN